MTEETPSRPRESFPRNQQLDVLRGAAILLVLVWHSIFLRQPTWDVFIWRDGWSGADLFFVVVDF
jgi:peptidoglycan/LPS O-acetylase OafA/YrhL